MLPSSAEPAAAAEHTNKTTLPGVSVCRNGHLLHCRGRTPLGQSGDSQVASDKKYFNDMNDEKGKKYENDRNDEKGDQSKKGDDNN
jgi:hypothetical protein